MYCAVVYMRRKHAEVKQRRMMQLEGLNPSPGYQKQKYNR